MMPPAWDLISLVLAVVTVILIGPVKKDPIKILLIMAVVGAILGA